MISSEDRECAETIGGYRILAELGQGGMARVYRAVDERTGRLVALKSLVSSAMRKESMQAMFEREYHTLVQLAHPRIVRAFDYGVDGDEPYYTMELLEGADARETTREHALGVREACLILRDVTSALALIHSRGLVHRDISLRNLWCTPDGRGKLIDFGTLVAMGPQSRVAGTAPFVPPEAAYAQPLDARCDLYGLGAVAYYLLTQRNAYPAREVSDLRHVWQRRPKPPEALRPDVPRALSELVMGLLSLDVRGRPASAAEVYERLTAIAELPGDDESHVAQSFLTSPKLVGRDEPSALFRKRLQRLRRKGGDAVAIVAPAGLGRSRMLASCVLEAKLMGATVVSVDAGAVSADGFGVAGAIAERVLEVSPLSAAEVLDVAGVLGHVSPALHKALGEPKLVELKPYERVRRLSVAVVALVAAASRRQPLVIAVDDVHLADGVSLGALASIAKLSAKHRVLLVTSCDERGLHDAPPVLHELALPEQRIELAPLRAEDTHELLGSVFGATSGLGEAATWLHDVSRGSPQACMQYAQYLVDHGVARFEGGQWKLPPHLREQGLPATLGAMLQKRLAELSPDARALALGLALARDETRSIWQPDTHVRIEDYRKLLDPPDSSAGAEATGGDAARAFQALDELLRAGLVQQRDLHYALAQHAMVDALLRASNDAERAVMHDRLAQILDQPVYRGTLLSVRQLQRAGQHVRARALLVRHAAELAGNSTSMNWGAMRVSLSAQCSRVALAHWERERGAVMEGIILRRLAAMVAAVYDWSDAQVGDAQIAQLRADCGLVYWDETDPALPQLDRVVTCLTRAQQSYDRTPEAERGLPPADAVRELASLLITILGAHVHAHDVARVRALPAVLEPLRPLSPLLALICDLQSLGVDRVVGRELGERIAELGVHQLFAQTALPAVLRSGGAGVYAHLQAMEDARRGRRRDLLELLVPFTGEDMYLVVHARWLGNAFRGQSALAEGFRKRVDLATEDDLWRRKAFLYIEAELYGLTGDLPALHRSCEAIAELARAFPGWRPWHAWARGMVHRLRGEYDAAQTQLDLALADAPPGEHRAWLRIAPARAELLLLRGDAEGALAQTAAMIENVRTLSLDSTVEVAAERVRALAQSRLARREAADEAVQSMFTLARKIGYDGLPLAQLHEAHARVAIAAGRNEQAAIALGALRALIEHANAPGLINAYEMMRAEISELPLPELGAPRDPARVTHSGAELSTVATQVLERMNALSGRQERARHALELLLEDAGAEIGHLFVFDATGLLLLAASSEDGPSSPELLGLARKHVDAEVQNSSLDAVTEAVDVITGSTSAAVTLIASGLQLSPVLLRIGERVALCGVALVGGRERAPRSPRDQLLQALSRCMLTAGDTIPIVLAG